MNEELTSLTSDDQARQRIRSSLEESLLVEAAAGTGKTSELVRRLVAILATGRTVASRIVAVTFTRKAAGELRLRLREGLDKARAEAEEANSIFNLEQAIVQIEEARIGTIHSFCADLLRERPVEARVDPSFEELSEEECPRMFDLAFRKWIEEKLADTPPGLRRALSRSLGRQDFYSSLSPLESIKQVGWKLLEWRDYQQRWRREIFDREVLVDSLITLVEELSEISWKCKNWRDELRQGLRPVRDLATWVRRAEREQSRDYDRLEALLISLLRDLKRPANQKKGRGDFATGVPRKVVLETRAELQRRLDVFKVAADADLAASLQEEMMGLIGLYEEQKARAGKLDFVDLLVRTRDLLYENTEIRAYFQERFSHVFLDEFQDTDPLQAEILLLLAADNPLETDWRRIRPVPGKLFLVGDPKQSIYRFRKADVLLYQELKEILCGQGVGLIKLTRSFRSVRPVQMLVNAGFETEMKEDLVSGQPGYVSLDEYRPGVDGQPAVIVLPVPRPYGLRSVANYAIEKSFPDAVGAFIEWLLRESGWLVSDPDMSHAQVPVASRHLCILFRRFVSWGKDVTRGYTRSLESRGIAHVLVGSRSFHQREEVETVRTALTAIEWPDDQLSVFATLRGSLFWLPDALLLRFKQEIGSLHPFRPIPADLDRSLEPVVEGLKVLADLHRKRNRRPVVETVHELLGVTRAHAGFALRPAGHQVLANIQRICDRARTFEANGTSFRAFVDYLRAESERPSAAEAPVLEEGVDGVRLMTVHGAKGLEFPVVILADPTCNISSMRPDKFVDNQSGLAAFTVLGCAPWELIDHQEEELARDAAEGVRIAYVAATRARDLLVVPAVGDTEREGWLNPLNKSVFPAGPGWRTSEKHPGCPEFGDSSVLERPYHYDGATEFSVKPGLHKPKTGNHEVVWWDPSRLRLDVQANFGLQQEQILAADPSGRAADGGLKAYQEWLESRRVEVQEGKVPSFEILSVTERLVQRAPPEAVEISFEILTRQEGRPSGARFGTLVHTVLRDVSLGSGLEEVRRLVRIHGRLLDVTDAEVEAAVVAVNATLSHPLLRRASQSFELHREYPLVVKLSGCELMEGVIDLAFVEDGRWVVIDFKTDADLELRREHYVRQVQWYVYGLARISGQVAEGWLFGI